MRCKVTVGNCGVAGCPRCGGPSTLDAQQPERTYTAEEVALEHDALVREAAARICVLCAAGNIPLFNNMTWVHHFRVGTPSSCYCNASSILAIPTDQPALDRYVAERVREAVLAEAELCGDHAVLGTDYDAWWQAHLMIVRAAASHVSAQAGAPEETSK